VILVDAYGHLVSDSDLNELHEFANKIGLKSHWFQMQSGKNWHPHYDLITRYKKPNSRLIYKAVELGAKLVSPKEIVRSSKRLLTAYIQYQP
jgi:Protein of unknown function (DUF4031)